MSDDTRSHAVRDIAHIATRAWRAEIQASFVAKHGLIVQAGPFAGMILPARVCWGDGDTLPKLLGCYEAELHQWIAAVVATPPDLIVNVGAAEGYYAVGLARLMPNVAVYAFNSAALSGDICREAAQLNDVAGQITVAGHCGTDTLQTLLATSGNPFLLCDCEGEERNLIDPARVPALAAATIVVECHDFIDTSITQTLIDRLTATHELQGVRESARDPNAWPFLTTLNSLDRWVAVCEYRPCTMHWLYARPKSAT